MKLGLKKDEVFLVPHTSEWDAEFIKIKQQIQNHTQIENNRIEHIGSTSIKIPEDVVVERINFYLFSTYSVQALPYEH